MLKNIILNRFKVSLALEVLGASPREEEVLLYSSFGFENWGRDYETIICHYDPRYFGWYWRQSQTWEAWQLSWRRALEPTVTPLP